MLFIVRKCWITFFCWVTWMGNQLQGNLVDCLCREEPVKSKFWLIKTKTKTKKNPVLILQIQLKLSLEKKKLRMKISFLSLSLNLLKLSDILFRWDICNCGTINNAVTFAEHVECIQCVWRVYPVPQGPKVSDAYEVAWNNGKSMCFESRKTCVLILASPKTALCFGHVSFLFVPRLL